MLAGSGHIAGVVNPPAADKYQYWTQRQRRRARSTISLPGANETKGSWWPDWVAWLRAIDPATVRATGPRKPGGGTAKALDEAPGRYVRER